MCGIAGYWQKSRISQPQIIDRMLEKIVHRGPDGTGAFSTDFMQMGHTRLAVIDLSSGDQPLYSPDKSLIYTGNGEFYNYKNERCKLTAKGYQFLTKSDNELALKYYQEFGLDFARHLRGEFAFALYDSSRERLILVRDRFGIRPLYYTVNESGVYYASEIKSMLANPKVNAKISKVGALHQLMQTMVPGMTLFEGVYALKPGHMLVIERENDSFIVNERCYWDASFPVEGEHLQLTDKEAISEVRDLLIESIGLRLEADVPVACYLSGGIDSCSIYGLASAFQQSPVTAFTIGFENKDFDETAIASSMTQKGRSVHEVLTLGAEGLYGQNYKKSIYHSERTFYNTLGVAKYLLSKKVNEANLKVVLTGEGADELFAGYPFFKQDLAQIGGYEELLGENFDLFRRKQNQLFSGSMLTNDMISHESFERLCGFTPNWIQAWIKTLRIVEPLLSDGMKLVIRDYDPIDAIVKSFDSSKIEGRHPLNVAQYTWIKTTLEGQILNWGGDRVDMAHSLETRPAFLDHKLAELAFSLNPNMHIRNGREKWILREAVKGVLPEVLYQREKFPFMAPPAHYDSGKKSALKNLCAEYLSNSSLEDLGILDPLKTNEFIETYFNESDPARATRQDVTVNHILGLHILKEQFVPVS